MGNKLKEFRERLGLKQRVVALALRAVERQADASLLSKYENGVCMPTREQIAALESLLQADRTELWDKQDLDLAGGRKAGKTAQEARKVVKRCHRISMELFEQIPEDLLEVYGFSSWQELYDAVFNWLVANYAEKKGAA